MMRPVAVITFTLLTFLIVLVAGCGEGFNGYIEATSHKHVESVTHKMATPCKGVGIAWSRNGDAILLCGDGAIWQSRWQSRSKCWDRIASPVEK